MLLLHGTYSRKCKQMTMGIAFWNLSGANGETPKSGELKPLLIWAIFMFIATNKENDRLQYSKSCVFFHKVEDFFH